MSHLDDMIAKLPEDKREPMKAAILELAKDIVDACKKNMTTKDGYGSALAVLSGKPKAIQMLLLAGMAEHGYPLGTLDSLSRLI
jgi:hypothetical protein